MKYLTVPIVREIIMFLFMLGCMTLGWGIEVKNWPLVFCFGFLFPLMYDWISHTVSYQMSNIKSIEEFEKEQQAFLRKKVEEIMDERKKNGQ